MKTYRNGMKSTEFTRRQVGAIFACSRKELIKVSDQTMRDFYLLADYYGYDDNRNIERIEGLICSIIDSIFKQNFSKAQKQIDAYDSLWTESRRKEDR